MNLKDLNKMADAFKSTEQMPVLFLGHGDPMNAIRQNEFTHGWQQIGRSVPKPNAILCISAHWETNGTFVTAMQKPKTIHDFYGFPKELFDVEYPAPGSPELAEETRKTVIKTDVGLDSQWGLDHGCWSVLKHLYPAADVPVIELSLDHNKPSQWHYELAKDLSPLRKKGVLIVGSGNMVHNLRMLDWNSPAGFDWAEEANEKMKSLIVKGATRELIDYPALGQDVRMAVPTPEHYLPLLYVMGVKDAEDEISFENDQTVLGSLSMTCVKIGKI
jgi:4,5-DOPA dioxygenase extradiol